MPDWFAECISPARFRIAHAESRPHMDLSTRLGAYIALDHNTTLPLRIDSIILM